MSSKAKHRSPNGFFDYPLAWHIAQLRNRKALRASDARVRASRREAKREAFLFDLKQWLSDD